MNYSALFIIGILAVAIGMLLAQWIFWRFSFSRLKRAKREQPSRPKPEPQSVEFNLVLSGMDDVEAGLERVEAAMVRIAEAADGVPVTINNYYSKNNEEEQRDKSL